MSLRERKKEKTARAILEAASARFASDGLDAARMEEIAADAEVSVGTLYNYFGSKQALLIALFEAEVREMLAVGSAAVSGDIDPVTAVRHLFSAYLDVLLATSRDLLREALRFSLGGGEAVHELARLDERLMEQLADLLGGYQQDGRLRLAASIEDAVYLLYSVLLTEILLFLSLAGLDTGVLHDNVARRVELVFAGIEQRE